MSVEKFYKITYDYRDQYLSAVVSGEEDSLEISLMFWKDIIEECQRKKYTKVLIRENFKNVISAIDLYILAEKLIELAPKNISVAFVDDQVEHMEMNRFTETIAYNRGGKGKVFADTAEAEKWLLEQE